MVCEPVGAACVGVGELDADAVWELFGATLSAAPGKAAVAAPQINALTAEPWACEVQ